MAPKVTLLASAPSSRRWSRRWIAMAVVVVFFQGFMLVRVRRWAGGTMDSSDLDARALGYRNSIDTDSVPYTSRGGGQGGAGRVGVASKGSAVGASRKEASRKEASRKEASRKEASGKEASRKEASGKEASGKEVRDPPVDPGTNGERLFVTDSNTPGVPDLYGYVEKYWRTMVSTRMYETLDEVSRKQVRSTVADMGLKDAVYVTSLGGRLRFLEALHGMMAFKRVAPRPKVAIVTTINNRVNSVEHRVLPWMQYHVEMGVDRFYVFYDGDDVGVLDVLNSLSFVTAITADPNLGSDLELIQRYEKHMGGTNAFSSSVAGVQRSNELLMTKQTFGMDEGVRAGRRDGMDWLLHIDTDELFLPEAYESIPHAFEAVDKAEPTVRFMNLEAQVEAGDVTAPFLQVNLFRNHQYFTTKNAQHYRSAFKLGMNSGFLFLYVNGKSAVRLDDATMPAAHGPHYWKATDATEFGVRSRWHNRISNSSYILHYSYTNPEQLMDKARRGCPQHWGNASVDFETLKKDCFVLDVDTRAFLAANDGEEAAIRFFYENFVYSEGAPTQCADYQPGKSHRGWCSMSDIATLKELMVRMRLMRRFTLPQVILMRHEQEILSMAM